MVYKLIGFLFVFIATALLLYLFKRVVGLFQFITSNVNNFTNADYGSLTADIVISLIIFIPAFFLMKYGIKFVKYDN